MKAFKKDFGIEIDFNASDLGRYFAWIEERAYRAVEMQKNVSVKVESGLKNLQGILNTGLGRDFGITKIKLFRDMTPLEVLDGEFGISKDSLSKLDRISRFFSQTKRLKTWAQENTDGIFTCPETFDDPRFESSDKYLLTDIEKFRRDIYPRIRNFLLAHKEAVQKIEVWNHNSSEWPFIYNSVRKTLVINLETMAPDTAVSSFEKIMTAILSLPSSFSSKILLNLYSKVNYGAQPSTFDYSASLEGIEALRDWTSKIEAMPGIRYVRFVSCRSNGGMMEEEPCEALVKEDQIVFEVPVARQREFATLPDENFTRAQISELISKALNK